MDGENKVAGVGVRPAGSEPTIASHVMDDLAGQMAERRRVAEEAAAAEEAARLKASQPSAEVAAVAAQLANENVEKPKEAVFDHKSEVAKKAKQDKAKKQLPKVLLVVLSIVLVVVVVILIINLINSANFAKTKERADGLYAATLRVAEEGDDNSCLFMLQNYTQEKVGVETYNAHADNCKKDLQDLAAAVKAAEGDAGMKKNSALATKLKAFKASYDSFAPELLGKIDAYKAGHEFFVTYNTLDLYENGEKSLAKLNEIVAILRESGDEKLMEFGESVVAKATAVSQGYRQLIEQEKKLVDKYGSVAAAKNDPAYAEYISAQKNYIEANEAYAAVKESVFKDDAVSNVAEISETLRDQAGALKASASRR